MRRRQDTPSLSLQGSRFRALDLARGRLALLICTFLMIYTILALRLVDVSVFQEKSNPPNLAMVDEGINKNTGNKSKKELAEIRHDIRDRNGVLLARSLEMTSLYADPKFIQEPVKTASAVAKLFPAEIKSEELAEILATDRRFVWIKRHLKPEEIKAVLRIGDPGLGFEKEQKRVYPQGKLTSHLVGYTDIDGNGLAGLEKGLDDLLKRRSENGKDKAIELSVDIKIQHLLKQEILKVVLKHKAKAGAGIVMDVKSGEVLGAVSLPDFDPHHLGRSIKDQRFNRYSLGLYELGSTFKIFSTAGYLDLPAKTLRDRFDTRDPIRKHGHIIRDYHGKNSVLTVPEVFIYSSNIGSAKMGEALGTSRMRQLFDDLALSDRLRSELPERGMPLIPEPWREMNTLTASYGHGIAVTPLHFISAAASIVNNGEFVSPAFLKQEAVPQADLKYSVVSPLASQKMRKLMRLVVTHGTGSLADVPGYLVGGKTGTAEKSGIGGYDRNKLISSFIGVFPVNDPLYAVFVMVDEPEGIPETYNYATGGWVAAPVVGNVIAGMGRILGIPKTMYEDEKFLAGLDDFVRTNEEFEDGVELIPVARKPGESPLNQPTTPVSQAMKESTLVSY